MGGATVFKVSRLTLTLGVGFTGAGLDGGEYIHSVGKLLRAISASVGLGSHFGAKIRNRISATWNVMEPTTRTTSDFAVVLSSGSISRLASPVMKMSGSTISRSSAVISGACSNYLHIFGLERLDVRGHHDARIENLQRDGRNVLHSLDRFGGHAARNERAIDQNAEREVRGNGGLAVKGRSVGKSRGDDGAVVHVGGEAVRRRSSPRRG